MDKKQIQATKGYLAYQKRMAELAKKSDQVARQEKISHNIEAWENVYAPRGYGQVELNQYSKETLKRIKDTQLHRVDFDGFILSVGRTAEEANTFAYAYIKTLIRKGAVEPSAVKRTLAIDGYSNINGMFQSRNWKDDIFSHDTQILVVERVSKELTSLANRDEERFWREVIEFTRDTGRRLIVCYVANESERSTLEANMPIVPFFTSDPGLNKQLILNCHTFNSKENIKNKGEQKYE